MVLLYDHPRIDPTIRDILLADDEAEQPGGSPRVAAAQGVGVSRSAARF